MKNIQILVPDMCSSHCQMRVNHAVNNLENSQVTSIQPGSVEVSLQNGSTQEAVIAAIEKAGYTVTGAREISADTISGLSEGENSGRTPAS